MNEHILVLNNANVLDVATGNYTQSDIVVRDGRIADVGNAGSLPANAEHINARGSFVLPGLIDSHVHVTALNADLGSIESVPHSYVNVNATRNLSRMLDRGFTSVRDASGADFGLAQAQREGLFRGSKIFFCGKALSQTGGHGDFRMAGQSREPEEPHCCAGIGRVADGVSAVRAAARDELRKGAHHIKVMASGGIASPTDRMDSTQYSEEEISAIVEEATASNRYVAAHAYTARAINRCLELGVRTIEHGNLLDDSSIDLFLKKDAFLVPTLATHWALIGEGRENGLSESSWQKVGPVFDLGVEAVRKATVRGVKIAYATDLLGNMQRHQNKEFAIRAKVQSTLQVIQSATSVAADLVQRTGDLGIVQQGAVADLLVVDNDPLEDISVLAEFEAHKVHIIQDGMLVG